MDNRFDIQSEYFFSYIRFPKNGDGNVLPVFGKGKIKLKVIGILKMY